MSAHDQADAAAAAAAADEHVSGGGDAVDTTERDAAGAVPEGPADAAPEAPVTVGASDDAPAAAADADESAPPAEGVDAPAPDAEPATDAAPADETAAEEPTEETAAEEPAAQDQAVTETEQEPAAEAGEPAAEEPAAEEPAAEEPAAEEPAVEAEAPATEAEEPAAEEPAAEEPAAEAEAPAAEEPTTEEPTTEEPTTEEPTTEEPTTEEPAAEEPAAEAEEPTAEPASEPAPEEPTTTTPAEQEITADADADADADLLDESLPKIVDNLDPAAPAAPAPTASAEAAPAGAAPAEAAPAEAPATTEDPFSMPPDLDDSVAYECVIWVKKRISLNGYRNEMWKEQHQRMVTDFFNNNNVRRLVVFVDPVIGLCMQFSMPTETVPELNYFVKESGKEVTIDNIEGALQYGVLSGAAMDSMLRVMNGVFVPIFLQNNTWPESFKKEFSAQLHKFMASLTETAHQVRGSTVLYVPAEAIGTVEEAAKEKDLVQRLESALIHWTRQIKEVVNNQDNSEHVENAGPLVEIEFWRSRTVDLSGIREQLDRSGVQRIVAVLEHAKSSYLQPFTKLSNLIQQGSTEAQDNLKFLSRLQAPCEELAQAGPKDIPRILPDLLSCVRMIWSVSRFYNTAERLTGLLRKVSNEIINRCCAVISPDEIFDGDVEASIKSLEESISAGEAWKSIYRRTVESMAAHSTRKWDFDESSIFAQIDAFVQRCRDLSEVCEGQIQFARKHRGKKADLPAFGGSRGPEIAKSLTEIENSFERHINALRSLDYNILDVKATRWHDDYNTFKHGVKDLEVMLQNVINSAFESISTVESGIELLEIFDSLAKREAIRRTVEKKTADVFALLNADLNAVKRDFDQWKKNPPIHAAHPRYAGAAFWAKSMSSRIDRETALLDAAHYLSQTREAEEARLAYTQLSGALDDYIKKTYGDWIQTIETGLAKRLESSLMVRNETSGLLESGFDKGLLRLFNEVLYWEKLHYEIPYGAIEIYSQREKLRILRENVLLVIRDYNSILSSLSSEERRLFAERIHYLDKKVNPGLVKLSWASKGIIEFVRDCRKHCRDVARIVSDFKSSGQKIANNCRLISETSLIAIEKKVVYELEEFEEKQGAHRQRVRSVLETAHREVKDIMRATYEVFMNDSDAVQHEWLKYVQKVDKMIQDALHQTAKKSLQEISRAINGDGKTEVHPLFTVNVVLDMQKVEFKPTMNSLTSMVNIISRELITTIKVVPRLVEVLDMEDNDNEITAAALEQERPSTAAANAAAAAADDADADAAAKGDGDDQGAAGSDQGSQKSAAAATAAARPPSRSRGMPVAMAANSATESFYDVISNDDDILKILVSIMSGMNSNVDKMTKYLTTWDKYKHIWELDKDAFIRRYAKANRPLAAFETDITRYRELQTEIQNEETISNVFFIRIDCSPLKYALVSHCNAWQNKFTTLLNQNAFNELQSLHDMFTNHSKKLRVPPRSLEMLGESLALLKKLQEDAPNVEARFDPVHAQYRALKAFEVPIKEDENNLLNTLQNEWQLFQETLVETERMLDGYKEKFKTELLRSMEDFSSVVQQTREDFLVKGPFESVVSITRAFDIINDFRSQVTKHRTKEAQIKNGLLIFNIEPPLYKELQATGKDLDLLDAIWTLTDEWTQSWEKWKTAQFLAINGAEMEEQASRFQKRVTKLGREIKQWEVCHSLKDRIDQFKRMLPLLQDLKNSALRDRHWEQLMEEVGKTFNPYGDEFTLEKIFSLGLDNHAEVINTLSNSASKELAIEESLAQIEETWKSATLDIVRHRDREHHKLRSADDIFQLLDDNQVMLSTIKASSYYVAFEAQVEGWERTLSLISETVEMLLVVQRQWMYLENIFMGSEDIRRQLPSESSLFETVNSNWKFVMDRLVADPNAMRGTHQDGMMDILNDMNSKLDKIQKSLDQYLETKRQAFPRFYFLSNDDLLEILGQARDPQAVQPHLKKCFDAINLLELVPPGKDGRKGLDAVGMHSREGEYVPYHSPVVTDGPVEMWLLRIEAAMRMTLKRLLFASLAAIKKTKRDKWVKEWAGQLVIIAGQIQWTADCSKALLDIEKGDKNSLRQLRKKHVNMLNKLSDLVRSQLTKVQRHKVNALVTIEVHARDVIDKMIKLNTATVTDFEWLSQLRFYWDKDEDDCVVRQTNARFLYAYEYLGNSGRLVITPLTDRCYLTLTTALHLKLGGSPSGPAGTGKTETVKDLGKALGKYVIVINCSESMDYKGTGALFSGLAQTGAWSCMDEFNRIDIEVLSVVAQQIMSVLGAITENVQRFVFEGTEIRLNAGCGIFVTMNPGYAGRTELPDNLKALFRPVAMMVPDSALIAEIMLFSEGFTTARMLSKKIVTLYQLLTRQLSRQDHYDFGLRSIKSILVTAGTLKRADPEQSEELILLRALRDMNLPKLVAEDVPLFTAIMSDLFPGVEVPVVDYGSLQVAIQEELREAGLQVHPALVQKIIQLYETKLTRHGVMVLGATASGKSTCWMTLQKAMTRLRRDNIGAYQTVKPYVINPKALTLGELYGESDLNTNEWTDGVLSRIMRDVCSDEKPDEKWIVFDGPVDTLWIESMNTLLDDNKILTLINSERISMPPQVSLVFEVGDLSQASPATVSRCGMIYMDESDLGWEPYVESWLRSRTSMADEADILRRLFTKYIHATLEFKRTSCFELVPTSDFNAVASLCALYDAVATPENGLVTQEVDFFTRMVELWFLFCLIWSVVASVDEEGRKRVDMFLREMDGQFPAKDTVYEYFVDPQKKGWSLWEDKIPSSWKYAPDTPFFRILVPTVDTIRYTFLLNTLVRHKRNVLLVGNTGTGKTSVIQNVLGGLDESYTSPTLNFSSRTSAARVQSIIESKVEKRTKDVFVPQGGKKMVLFIDDLNMPAKDEYGSQPPLELLRQWIDYGFWYDRKKQTSVFVRDMQLVTAMGPPGGGRSVISSRLQGRFHLINMTFPADSQVKRIFETLITQKLTDFEEEIKPLAPIMTQATIDVYQAMTTQMLPTPHKSHYLFNMRDLSKVFQGLMQAHRDFYDTREAMVKLWVHENYRVFQDRLSDEDDRKWFTELMMDKVAHMFGTTWSKLFKVGQLPIFGDFMREGMDFPVYEEIPDLELLKKHIENALEDFNLEPGTPSMDLVLFRDAIEHVCRIHRVISQPRGNALLVGVGGSGRQSLTRLAAYMAEFHVFQIELTKQYRQVEFHEDLKKLYMQTGVERKNTVFLFTDTQIVHESFLEDINNILSSGEVPSLFAPDDLASIRDAVRADAKSQGIPETAEALYAFFIERVRTHLHIVLCMSPVGESFRHRVRMFPGLVNCSTMDWFHEWPREALKEVSTRLLEDVDLGEDDIKDAVGTMFGNFHTTVAKVSKQMQFELKRHNYVTPTNFLELVHGYKKLLKDKREQLGESATKLRNGLAKLDETREQVQVMSTELEEKKVIVSKSQKDCEELLVVIVQERRVADEQAKQVAMESEKIAKEEAEVKAIADAAQFDLDEALPALEAAAKSLEALSKKDLAEVKAYAKPPHLVETVLSAVMILRKSEPSWAEAKRQLNDPYFLTQLINYDKDSMSDSMLKKIEKVCADPQFRPEIVGKVSLACRSLCQWVHAIAAYGRVYREVAPKKEALASATENLQQKQSALRQAREQLQEITDRVISLKAQYDESVATKERLKKEADETEVKLDRAEKLVNGLAGERTRWEASIKRFEESLGYLVGDCLLAAAFLSYAGPFPSNYRTQLIRQSWMSEVKQRDVAFSPDFSVSSFLAKATDVRSWNLQGLPSDSFSVENGVLVTRGQRWPLMIDPQGQANKWIKNMERDNQLAVIDLAQKDYSRTLENAIQFGTPVLCQDVGQELDPTLDPILNKAMVIQAGRFVLRFGDKELEYNENFRFYLTTRLGNPHYTPEVCTKTTLVNFAVKEQGLEDQLLGTVVKSEKPELEEQRDQLLVNMAGAKKRLEELEDEILRLLSSATGSLLEDEQLVMTLQSSKTTSEEIKQSLVISEQTEAKISVAREAYRPCAQRASLLFFVLNELSMVDHMYQFSLDSYIELFNLSMENSAKSDELFERIRNLNEYHTYATYRNICRGLFERHKLLFSFQMCIKIMQSQNKISQDEYLFFLKGGQVLDKSEQAPNPFPDWMPEESWDHITELDNLHSFRNIASTLEQNQRDWRSWYMNAEPEAIPLPGEWENKCNELQRMILVRCLRPDRVVSCITSFVINNLGQKFVEPPAFDLAAAFTESNKLMPLLFVLSPGMDPVPMLQQLTVQRNMQDRFRSLALGQGQAPIATRMIEDGIRDGHWVFLANCHLAISYMPQLEKTVESLPHRSPHPNFRLWLSSAPHPAFPMSILQRSIKMTTEPPTGLKANLLRMYGLLPEATFNRSAKPQKYKKLLFALCFYHSVLLERRKFLTLGWNIPYGFNDSDFLVCENILSLYLDEYDETPWDALKYLIAEASYGGRVTDELDRRVLRVYINHFFTDEAIGTSGYRLSQLPAYHIPDDGNLQSYKEFIITLPGHDRPEAFGQHPNADIASQIKETGTILDTVLSLQPRTSLAGDTGSEKKVNDICKEILDKLPEPFDVEDIKKSRAETPSPLDTVLLQELSRYNVLLRRVASSLAELQRGLMGLVVMSEELESVFTYLSAGKVPPEWLKTYPSMKPLASWTRDLHARIDMLQTWADGNQPKVFWLGALSFPTGFLTAVLQIAARKAGLSIDTLSWEFSVLSQEEHDITQPPKEGVYIKGVVLEGAAFDPINACLVEPEPMELTCRMPILHFKPVEAKKKVTKGVYPCPLFVYPERGATRPMPSFLLNVDLKAGKSEVDHWVRRGTALLLQTAN